MSDDAEWGPWVDHDGCGCPVVGKRVHLVLGCNAFGQHPDDDPQGDWRDVEVVLNGHEAICIAGPCPAWDWQSGWYPIIRYRVRRPNALRDLIDLVENLPAPAPQPEQVPA